MDARWSRKAPRGMRRSPSYQTANCHARWASMHAGKQRSGVMSDRSSYLRDGAAIYQRSFAIIRAEADLSRFSAEEADVAVRMIHACGQVDMARHIEFGPNLVTAARGALVAGAPN